MDSETILVVDDNQEIVYSISELLKYEGYQVVKAYDGMEALKSSGDKPDRSDPAGCDDAETERIICTDEIKGKLPYSGYYSVSEDGGE